MVTRGSALLAALLLFPLASTSRADGFFQVATNNNQPSQGDVGSLLTLQGNAADTDTTLTRFWGYRGFYGGGFYRPYWGGGFGGFYRPYYGGFYRPFYGAGFYRPFYYGGFYRPYFGGFYNYSYVYGGFPYCGYPYYSSYYYFTIGDSGDAEVTTADIKEPAANPYSSPGTQPATFNPYAGTTVLTSGFATTQPAAPVRKTGFAESR